MLRVTEMTSAIVHVPEILYHRRSAAGSGQRRAAGASRRAFEAGRRALEDAAARRGIDAIVVHHPRRAGSYHFMPHAIVGLPS